MLVSGKLGVAVRLVVESIERADPTTHLTKWEEDAKVVNASIDGESGKSYMNINGVEIEPSEKCLLSLYTSKDDKCLEQSIFNYEKDLEIPIKQGFPLEMQQYMAENENILDNVLRKISEKLGIIVYDQDRSAHPKEAVTEQKPSWRIGRNNPFAESLGRAQPDSFRRPHDMPSFEDEYEIRGHGNTPQGLQERIPSRYGENDLYPTGEKYPNLMDPAASGGRPGILGQGGMVFDPLQEHSRQRKEQENKLRGPGYMPGAKFDDPYGNPGGFGGLGGFGGGGSSGFI